MFAQRKRGKNPHHMQTMHLYICTKVTVLLEFQRCATRVQGSEDSLVRLTLFIKKLRLVLYVLWVRMDANPCYTYKNKESQTTWCLINSAQYWFLLVS